MISSRWPSGSSKYRPTAAVTVVHGAALGLARVGPVRQVLFPDAAERGVELVLAHEERIVLGRDIPAGLREIQ